MKCSNHCIIKVLYVLQQLLFQHLAVTGTTTVADDLGRVPMRGSISGLKNQRPSVTLHRFQVLILDMPQINE